MNHAVPRTGARVLIGSATHSRFAVALSTPMPDDQIIEIAIHLVENPNVDAYLRQLSALPVDQRTFLPDAAFDPAQASGAAYFGALPQHVQLVEDWVAKVNAGIVDPAQHLQISAREYDIHAVKVKGTAKQISDLFQVDLAQWKQDDGSLRMGHTKDATVPADIAPVVRGVIGFNTLGHFEPTYVFRDPPRIGGGIGAKVINSMQRAVHRVRSRMVNTAQRISGAAVPGKPLYPDQLAAFYQVPDMSGVSGAHVPRVAILEYGGRASQANLSAMGAHRGVAAGLIPQIESFYVGGIAPNDDAGANVECDLDAQVISVGLASKGIRHQLLEINALDTEMAAGDAVAWAARDLGNPLGGAGADVASESWGDPKWNWTPYAIEYRRSANKFALLKGVPVFVSSGDNGSRDTTPNVTVDYYSGDDLNVGVGGTQIWIDAAGTRHAVAWSGTGGGVDTDVATPSYQSGAGITPISALNGRSGRGTPDVAADAAPNSGCIVLTGDTAGMPAREQPIGGTSEAAPLWAEFFAVLTAKSGRRVGPPHGVIYATWKGDQSRPEAQRVLRDITQGSNGDYSAAPGWDACTGVGEPADVGRLTDDMLTVTPIAPGLRFALADSTGRTPDIGRGVAA